MTREQRIEGAAFLAALVCAVCFPHSAGAETGIHAHHRAAVAPAAIAALDSGVWLDR
jgi:hypothetical protein